MYMWNFSVALELFCFASHSLQLRCCFCCPAVCLMPRSDASKTALLEWYFKTITIQQPPSYQNSTGLQTISKLSSKLLHSRTSHLLLVSPLISLRYLHLIRLSGPSAQLTRICYLCHAATAVDKEVFPTVPLKSATTHHFRSVMLGLGPKAKFSGLGLGLGSMRPWPWNVRPWPCMPTPC